MKFTFVLSELGGRMEHKKSPTLVYLATDTNTN